MFNNPTMEQPFIPCKIEQIKPNQIFSGLIQVTKYGISILPENADSTSCLQQPFWLHSLLVNVDKKVSSNNYDSSSSIHSSNLQNFKSAGAANQSIALYITYRNFTALKITFRGVNGDGDALQVWGEIQKWMNATSIEDLHCFSPSISKDLKDNCTFGQIDASINLPSLFDQSSTSPWFVFDPYKDFQRMGLGTLNTNWRISTINYDYELIPTYPSLLGVPSKISDNTLRHIAKFRSKGRIPSLSYLHSNKYSITRSAQPLVGWKSDRSIQDEKHIEAIFKSHLSNNEVDMNKSQQHLIIDARPIANAMAQTALGAGTEPESHYPFCKLVFLGIENIHVVRDSFSRLYDACVTEDGAIVSKQNLDKSGWLKHIKSILEGTLLIVEAIHLKNLHVLIHCSDGWDRTAQLSSLAQICLDPYYRTIDGLMVLLEKEWCSFGHKFKDRCGHLGKGSVPQDTNSNNNQSVEKKIQKAGKNMLGVASKLFQSFAASGPTMPTSNASILTTSESISPSNVAPKEISPVFPQFLDCLYQIWKQYPTEFEFDERILEFLFIAAYSCSFGNFLFNNEKEAKTFRTRWSENGGGKPIEKASISVWKYIAANRSAYLNPIYTPRSTDSDRFVLIPSSSNLTYWSRVYRLTKHNYSEEDALLTPCNTQNNAKENTSLSMESLNLSGGQNAKSLDHLDPLVETVTTVDIKSVGAKKYAETLSTSELVDLQNSNKEDQTTNTLKIPMKASEGFIDNPLMSNPWS